MSGVMAVISAAKYYSPACAQVCKEWEPDYRTALPLENTQSWSVTSSVYTDTNCS